MENRLDTARHPYGLGGGTILSGSVSVAGEAFWYYPLTATTANIKFNSDYVNTLGSVTFTAGVGVYGMITQVTQSSGIAMLYSGSTNIPRY